MYSTCILEIDTLRHLPRRVLNLGSDPQTSCVVRPHVPPLLHRPGVASVDLVEMAAISPRPVSTPSLRSAPASSLRRPAHISLPNLVPTVFANPCCFVPNRFLLLDTHECHHHHRNIFIYRLPESPDPPSNAKPSTVISIPTRIQNAIHLSPIAPPMLHSTVLLPWTAVVTNPLPDPVFAPPALTGQWHYVRGKPY
jgi:hypothetical protein